MTQTVYKNKIFPEAMEIRLPNLMLLFAGGNKGK